MSAKNKNGRQPDEKAPKTGKSEPEEVVSEIVDEFPQQPAADANPAQEPEKAAEPEKKAEPVRKEPSPEELLKSEKDRYLRLLAEYDNYRKRSSKERENIYQDVRADTVTKFLPVYDNLVRALEQSTQDDAYRKGVEMIMTQFNDILAKLGVSEIPAMGEKFDPAVHNAVMHEEDPEKGEGEIVQELQRGFRMGDKVIRFGMVKTVN